MILEAEDPLEKHKQQEEIVQQRFRILTEFCPASKYELPMCL
jgi:hypothetical protein